ncbi:glycogen debranching N-terminal domain-containing protein [Conexibacter stalactiti]|uniref:Glycogen debranching N-terminal domain-containing protein n=1 Tax=Conexibacter stalactiti TaxID=1940611 RepID=A0ABU4HWI8_9ACTN|nr:glycogen debranching N-terminal domain-containing protein [Conexibacter stalactiti]MDW5596870.1 glycogen debranching N-terminal domain-containing protein [Conexibacter stalactiti]MEC5037512.1 glycogen debranching N-terminal domain-containing protein [Conexibacter stalactiti]
MPERTLSVLDGSTFVIGDRSGDVRADEGREHGFFSEDTRFLSRWVLRIGATPLQLLGLDQAAHFSAGFFLAPVVDPDDSAAWSVIRRRLVDEVWSERITVTNHRHEPVRLHVALEVDTDFADLFEVKDGAVAAREILFHHDDTALVLAYAHERFRRSVEIVASRPATITRHGFEFTPQLAPAEQWSVDLTLTPQAAQPGAEFPRRTRRGDIDELTRAKAGELEEWLAAAPKLETDNGALARTYRASLSDLAALRMRPELHQGATLPAAGLPWFMALFGRDSLITSFQALPYLPGLAATALRTLAAHQATSRDDFHEQEPGKILHELRFGELTANGERPHSPYYGTADATPLFVVLLDEYHRWTGDDALVRELEPHARAALRWIEESGDADGDGYVEYARRNDASGLANQCWKDSWDAIQFADGRLARGPIATCEIQGYVYDARRRAARLAREVWDDPLLAEQLERQAAALRVRFHEDFWMPERGCCALALDGDKRRVDSVTSNIGHLLWSGLLDDDAAAATAERLLEPQLWSGWGVRTLGTAERGYNPLGYHTGTVWPHENSLIAAGLARYGHRDAATRVALAVLSAAPHFEHRLPEVFGGFPAAMTSVPVAFPTASRPQAWAAGAPLQLLSTLLRLTPAMREADAMLPQGLRRVALRRPTTSARRLGAVGSVNS